MMPCYSDETPFLSIIIPGYQRFPYLKEVVESIHAKADAPFELLIHDDNSTDGTKDLLLTLKNELSTIIINNGLNMGLSESINRLVRLAGSNYILMLNADVKVEKPLFQDILNVLQKPYVGFIAPMSVYNDIPNVITSFGSSYTFNRGLGSGCCLAFRKDVWNSVGGWNNTTAASGNADVSFMIRTIKAGYFPLALVRPDTVLSNMSMDRHHNFDSTMGQQESDCSLPKIFNSMDYNKLSKKRYTVASNTMQITYREPAGEVNIQFWHDFMQELITTGYKVDWEVAQRYGHIKWKDMIENVN